MKRKKYRILNTELQIQSWKVKEQFENLNTNILAKARLLEQIILYDRIYIATKNFLVLPLLADWFGFASLIKLLNNYRFGFVRQDGFLVYDGKYLNVEWLQVQFPNLTGDFDSDWLRIADTAKTERAVEAVIQKTMQNLSRGVRYLLIDAVSKNTKTFGYEEVGKIVRCETEKDFKNPNIRESLKIKADSIQDAGKEFGENQLKVGFGENGFNLQSGTEIEKALALAFSNYDLALGQAINDTDIHTDNLSKLVLEAKLKSSLKWNLKDAGFNQLLTIRSIPDFVSLVVTNSASVPRLIEMADYEETLRMRDWLHNLKVDSKEDILKDYIDWLEKYFEGPRFTIKAIRFLVTKFIGLLNPVLGLAASVTNSFLIDKLLKKWHPKLFLDKLRSNLDK